MSIQRVLFKFTFSSSKRSTGTSMLLAKFNGDLEDHKSISDRKTPRSSETGDLLANSVDRVTHDNHSAGSNYIIQCSSLPFCSSYI